MKKIKIKGGKYMIVDDEDYPVLVRFIWRLDENNKPITQLTRNDGYTPTPVSIVKFLIKSKPKNAVHFISNNYLDCRKSNLELRTNTELVHKTEKVMIRGGKLCTSKYKGVYFDNTTKKWFAVTTKTINGKKKRFTTYRGHSEKEAAKAYNKKARELYGEWAYQNKI